MSGQDFTVARIGAKCRQTNGGACQPFDAGLGFSSFQRPEIAAAQIREQIAPLQPWHGLAAIDNSADDAIALGATPAVIVHVQRRSRVEFWRRREADPKESLEIRPPIIGPAEYQVDFLLTAPAHVSDIKIAS